MPDVLSISQNPVSVQNFILNGWMTRDASGYYFRQIGAGSDSFIVPTFLATLTHECTLQQIESVRVHTSPFGNPYPCIVFGETPNPKIGQPQNLHYFPGLNANFVPYDPHGHFESLNYTYTAYNGEMKLPPSYRFFSVHVYDSNTAASDPFLFGMAFPPAMLNPASPASIGQVNNAQFSGPIFITFYGR